jgi:hypothetical protein
MRGCEDAFFMINFAVDSDMQFWMAAIMPTTLGIAGIMGHSGTATSATAAAARHRLLLATRRLPLATRHSPPAARRLPPIVRCLAPVSCCPPSVYSPAHPPA